MYVVVLISRRSRRSLLVDGVLAAKRCRWWAVGILSCRSLRLIVREEASFFSSSVNRVKIYR